MKFCVFCVIFLLVLPSGYSKGFFSKFTNQRRAQNNEHVDVCETIRIMPRTAMAVVGGAPLRVENSAPYIAAVGERISNGSISWFCGGSLISPRHVLTAAHCLVSRNVSTVRVGSFSTKERPTHNDYEVIDTIIHSDYKITQSYHDIGILKVKDVIEFDSNIKPVCLPQSGSDTYEREKAKVIGWGAQEFGGEGTQKLQQVEVDIFSNSDCEKAYSNSTIAPKTFPKGIINQQLCAGSKKGGKDACQGDSGGPLVLTDEHGVVRQIGIVSTGAGCGFKMYPGVYTRVSSYLNWIQNQIKNTQTKEKQNPQKNEHSSKENLFRGNIHQPNLKDTSHSSRENSQKENLQLPKYKETSHSSKENFQKGNLQHENLKKTSNSSKENSHRGNNELPKVRENSNESRTHGKHINTEFSNGGRDKQEINHLQTTDRNYDFSRSSKSFREK